MENENVGLVTEIEFFTEDDQTEKNSLFVDENGLILHCEPTTKSYARLHINGQILSPEIWEVGDRVQVGLNGSYGEMKFPIKNIRTLNTFESEIIYIHYQEWLWVTGRKSKRTATCIGCGCDDNHACFALYGPCSWLVVNRRRQIGVCSQCRDCMDHWKKDYQS